MEGWTSKWRKTRVKQPMYGMGWRIFQYNGNHKMIFHAGGLSGVRSRLGFLPEKDIGIVMLWNANESHPEVLMPMLFDRLLDLPEVDYLDGAAGRTNYVMAQSASAQAVAKPSVKRKTVASHPSKKKVTRTAAAPQKKKATHKTAPVRRVSAKPAVGVVKPLAVKRVNPAPVKAGEIRSLTAERVGYDPAVGPAGKK